MPTKPFAQLGVVTRFTSVVPRKLVPDRLGASQVVEPVALIGLLFVQMLSKSSVGICATKPVGPDVTAPVLRSNPTVKDPNYRATFTSKFKATGFVQTIC